ncbi:18826_t:CDS:2, partial [Racocetra persica]
FIKEETMKWSHRTSIITFFRNYNRQKELKNFIPKIFSKNDMRISSRNLLEQMLTSYVHKRLEWIGDSIISTVVADYLFFRFQDYKEGTLTTLRSNIVCKEALAVFSRKLGLDNELRLGKGALAAGDRNNERILEDTFEAYIGAIYLDCGRNLNDVIEFMEPIIKPFVDDLVANSENGHNSSNNVGVVY